MNSQPMQAYWQEVVGFVKSLPERIDCAKGLLFLFVVAFGSLLLGLSIAGQLNFLIMFGTVVLAAIFLYIWKNYIHTAQDIREWTQRIRAGDLRAQIESLPKGEFAETIQDLHFVGEMLQSLSRDAETQLQQHTNHMARKTQSLSMLYDVASSINISRNNEDLLSRFLHMMTEMVDARAAAVYLLKDIDQTELIAHIGADEALFEGQARLPIQKDIPSDGEESEHIKASVLACDTPVCKLHFGQRDTSILAIPIQYRGKILGAYNFYLDAANLNDSEDIEGLFASIGRHLGIAVEKSRLDEEATMLSIMRERTHIANELHDSLAQTLTSIRFQVRVLDETLHQGDEAQAWQELERIEASISEAHTEIRELIAHFRDPVANLSLTDSVEQVVERFRLANDEIHVFFQNEWALQALPQEMEFQVLRIIQEALTNIRKHSEANTVRIMMRGSDDGIYKVLIEDDGVGFDQPTSSGHSGEHIGLNIMQDRATRIGGHLAVESEPGEGVQLMLEFAYPVVSNNQKQANI